MQDDKTTKIQPDQVQVSDANQPEQQNQPVQSQQPEKLWTKNFKIITAGTVVSKLGSAIAGFATGLLILDYTGSTFLFALYMVMYNLPKVIMPVLAGPLIDKFSRRKTIYSLDFLSASIYVVFAIIIQTGNLNFVVLLLGCMALGAIDSVYCVAYDSFYPMLVSKGNYTKAYSISSTLDSLTMIMVPVSAFLYNLLGIVPLFVLNTVSFFAAAVMETQIHVEETYVKKEEEEFGFRQYKKTFQEGIAYLKANKGLLAITAYFTVSMFAQGSSQVIGLPFFKQNFPHGEYVYIEVMAFLLIGRLLGGVIHYKVKLPTDKKYRIALFVYFMVTLIDGSYLYFPIAVMMLCCFVDGILGVTSYNIRISATQSFVPDDRKGRFNGIFQMSTTVGMMIGELLSGALADVIEQRLVVSIFMGINMLAVIFIMGLHEKEVKPIYNRQA